MMPVIRWLVPVVMAAASLCGCGVVRESLTDNQVGALPRQIRAGGAEMVIERVNPDTPQQEILLAIQAHLDREKMCFAWPSLWLDSNERRGFYYARYDLMARDWGADVARAGRARMQELVDMGFLTARPRPDIGADIIEYALTPEGASYLRGSPYGSERASFCSPSQRRVVAIAQTEWGDFPCGSLRLSFQHSSDQWPSWARTEAARQRVTQTWGAPTHIGSGSVTLSRQWFRPDLVPDDMRQNGELRSVCYNSTQREVVGDDFELSPPSP